MTAPPLGRSVIYN